MAQITEIRLDQKPDRQGLPMWRVDYQRSDQANFLKVFARDEEEARRIATLALVGPHQNGR